MPTVPVRDLGNGGIVLDTPAVLLPPNTFSNGRNVRFHNESVAKMFGHQQLFDLQNTVENLLYWPRQETVSGTTTVGPSYLFATDTAVFRQGPTGTPIMIGSGYTAGGFWQSTLFNGGYTAIFNNTLDAPQYITTGNTGVAAETMLQPLISWPAGLTAGVIKPIGYALMAGNLRQAAAGTIVMEQPGSIRISSQAAPGSIPTNWNVGAALLTTADEFELSQTSPVTDMVDLRGYTLVFTENSIHRVQVATGRQPTQVQNLNIGRGALAVDCAAEFDGHVFAVDFNDIYITSGSGAVTSVADHAVRDYFFRNLNQDHYRNTFVVRNIAEDEMWIIYPTQSSTGPCDEAMIWNYRHRTWSIRDMPGTRGGVLGPRVENNVFTNNVDYMSFTGDTSLLHTADIGNTFNGVNFEAYVEKRIINFGDLSTSEQTSDFYPLMDGVGEVQLDFLGTDAVGEPVDFTTDPEVASTTFNIATDYKVDPRQTGRFLNFRLSSNDANSWRLAGYDIDTVESTSRRR